MRNGDSASINPMVPGRKVDAIFGFCDIRNFTDTTEILQDKVMVYVNRVRGEEGDEDEDEDEEEGKEREREREREEGEEDPCRYCSGPHVILYHFSDRSDRAFAGGRVPRCSEQERGRRLPSGLAAHREGAGGEEGEEKEKEAVEIHRDGQRNEGIEGAKIGRYVRNGFC